MNPIRCFGCGNYLYEYYVPFSELASREEKKLFFDENNIKRFCCRRMLIN